MSQKWRRALPLSPGMAENDLASVQHVRDVVERLLASEDRAQFLAAEAEIAAAGGLAQAAE